MHKYLVIFLFLFLSNFANAESLGKNKTINDYLENGYQIQSINVINQNKFLYNLLNNGSKEKMFEPKLVSCIYEKEKQITDCFKP